MGKKSSRWGVILDAGSSGTRLHIYSWKDPAKASKKASGDELQRLPKLKTDKDWTKKIRPGVSTFGENPTEVGRDHLETLVQHAVSIIPEDKVKDTPIFLMATAGMRLLPQLQQTALLREICSYFRQNTQFLLPDCDTHIQVIKGETEGLYGWLAANYLLGGFDFPQKHAHGKGHTTYGFLDMGGASAQIAFAPNNTEAEKHANDLKLVRLRTLDGNPREYKVFTATWLGFGVNEAHDRYIKSLEDMYEDHPDHELPDSCMPKGLQTNLTGAPAVGPPDSKSLVLTGTGDFDDCLKKTYPLLEKDAKCEDEPCLLNGQHVPAIDFDVNHFIGVSEYWHTTHGPFKVKGDKAYDLATYQDRVKAFCSQDWKDIEATIEPRGKLDAKSAQEACFKASWLMNVLYEGIGIPRAGLEKLPSGAGRNATKGALEDAKDKGFLDPFQPVDKIDGVEVSWTLGKMVLYAAGQVRPTGSGDGSLVPVGFGSNVEGVPTDFQFAGSNWQPVNYDDADHDDDDDDWGETADELLEKAKSKSVSGVLVFILILLVLLFLLRKRDRRMRLLGRFGSILRRSRRPGSPRKAGRGFSLANKLFGRSSASYERVLEDGEADQFELADIDSDDTDHSDSSDGSRIGRSSGLATPKLNVEMFEDPRGGSALNRSGLVVRTESRERLAPSLQMLGAGKRSRTGSPTRLKSPVMSPLQED